MTHTHNTYPYDLPGKHVYIETPLCLDSGVVLDSYNISYTTYGTLNTDKTNAVMVLHSLTGDQYVTDINPITKKLGWWHQVVGKNRPIDTDQYFVICANILGGCMGTEGPKSINPKTNTQWRMNFPMITLGDMVKAHIALLDSLDISTLHTLIGGSMGGMQAMIFASQYTHRTKNIVIIGASPWLNSRNIGFNRTARHAVMFDPEWHNGNYADYNTSPKTGLSIARMNAHMTYLSEQAMDLKFGRKTRNNAPLDYQIPKAEFEVEGYLLHQGKSFVNRFDANSYLYISRAMDYFDMHAYSHTGELAGAFTNSINRFCIISISSDWLHRSQNAKKLVHALNALGLEVTFAELQSDAGHDAFFLDEPQLHDMIQGFING